MKNLAPLARNAAGILAIAAAKSWQVPVLACDIDRNSVKVAAENVGLNHVALPAEQKRLLLVAHQQQRFQMPQKLVGAPVAR